MSEHNRPDAISPNQTELTQTNPAEKDPARPYGRLTLPAAERNGPAITELVTTYGPKAGKALEIASGAGQHVHRLAQALPNIDWQPTDIAPDRIGSIDLYCRDLPNVAPARMLDATQTGWSSYLGGLDLILLVNLTHLISTAALTRLIQEVGRALVPGGFFILYGPFMRAGELTSPGDETFHADLIARDPNIGYKDDFDVTDLIQSNAMELTELTEMPANNLAFVARRFG